MHTEYLMQFLFQKFYFVQATYIHHQNVSCDSLQRFSKQFYKTKMDNINCFVKKYFYQRVIWAHALLYNKLQYLYESAPISTQF